MFRLSNQHKFGCSSGKLEAPKVVNFGGKRLLEGEICFPSLVYIVPLSSVKVQIQQSQQEFACQPLHLIKSSAKSTPLLSSSRWQHASDIRHS